MAAMNPEEMTFGNYVRMRRRALDLTQEALAQSVPCSRVTIRRVEADDLRPSRELAALLADRLGIPPADRDGFVRFARGIGPAPGSSAATHDDAPREAGLTAIPAQGAPSVLRHNLPAPLTAFVGREAEVEQIRRLLADRDCRLLTLTGPGGTGKTRLALRAASEAAHGFPDGACFVPLGALTDPALVGPAIARGLGIEIAAGRPIAGTLATYLKDRRLLLVLDAFEGVPDAAPLAGELLAGAADLKILVTSRTLLRLSGEYNFPVPPLPCPGPGDLDAAQVAAYPAVRLYVIRAEALKPGFVLDQGNAQAVAEICRRVDGLPLAIELAAARIALLSPQALLNRLEHRLPILTGGPRDWPERQRTLRDTIDWSYQLLDEDERRTFRGLAVFAGGWDLAAAESVVLLNPSQPEGTEGMAGASPGIAMLADLTSLAGKSLIQPREGPGGEPRFVMLDTIREYGIEQLAACGEEDAVRRAHAWYYVGLAEEGEIGLRGHEQAAWGRRLAAEQDNFRAALGWAIQSGDSELSLRLAASLRMFWDRHGDWSEGSAWLERALALPGGSSRARARVLVAAATMQFARADTTVALAWLEEGRALAEVAGDQATEAAARMIEGRIWAQHRDAEAGTTLMEEAVALARKTGDPWLVAWISFWLGWELNFASLRPNRARAALGESLALFETCGDRLGRADCLAQIAAADSAVARNVDDYRTAMALMDEAASLFRELDAKAGLVRVLSLMGDAARDHEDFARAHAAYDALEIAARSMGLPIGLNLANRGALALQEGDLDESRRLLLKGWADCAAQGQSGVMAFVLAMLGSLLAARGEPDAAATVLGCARAALERLGADLQGPDLRVFERGLATARAEATAEAFDAAWALGGSLTMDAGYDYARQQLTQVQEMRWAPRRGEA